MDIKRQLSVALLLATGTGLLGCRSGMGGLAFWSSKDTPTLASTTPDAGSQQSEGLAKQSTSSTRGLGSSAEGTAAMGGPRPAEPGFFTSAWDKTSAAVTSAFTFTPREEPAPDATRLDSKTKAVGADVHVAAARLMENQGKLPEAEAQYQKALKATPNDLHALIGLARLHDRQGQSPKAIALYQQALKAHPKNALVHNDLGLCYARQRDLPKSIASITKAVELDPKSTKYRNNLATILVEAGRPEDALKQLAAVNSEAVAHYNVGYLLQQNGQTSLSINHYQQAIALDPNMAPAREMLAQFYGNAAPAGDATRTDTRVVALPAVGPAAPSAMLPSYTVQPATQSSPAANGYHIGDDLSGAAAPAAPIGSSLYGGPEPRASLLPSPGSQRMPWRMENDPAPSPGAGQPIVR